MLRMLCKMLVLCTKLDELLHATVLRVQPKMGRCPADHSPSLAVADQL